MLDPPDIDGYEVGAPLGEGAVAVVYGAQVVDPVLALQISAPDMVALKVLKPEALAHENIVASFQYENRVLSRLDHDGIMGFYDSGSGQSLVFAAVELVAGTAFDEHLLAKGKLRQSEAVDVATQIVDALGHLHDRGYVHRDLKPGNLMVTDAGKVVLMDFGAAVKIGAKIDYEVGLYGTVPFLSPEQVKKHSRIDGRADLYAVGVLLYRMVTGQRPFQGTREDILLAHVHTEPVPPSTRSRISPELDAFIVKALAKSPDDRHANAAEMLVELAAIGEAGEPAKPSFGQRLGFGRRR